MCALTYLAIGEYGRVVSIEAPVEKTKLTKQVLLHESLQVYSISCCHGTFLYYILFSSNLQMINECWPVHKRVPGYMKL